MKLIYIVAAVAMLAMLIPSMALPVSAADGYEVVLSTVTGDPDGGYESVARNWVGYDVFGSYVVATLVDSNGDELPAGTVTAWSLVDDPTYDAHADWVGADPNEEEDIPSHVTVKGEVGQVSIEAMVGTTKYTATKKWAKIDYTEFNVNNGSSELSWNETTHSYFALESITDTVYADFPLNANHPVQGVILNWYLFDSSASISKAQGQTGALVDAMDALQETKAAAFVEFVDPSDPNFQQDDVTEPFDGWLGTKIQTVTDASGSSTVYIDAWDKEAVKIVVIPEYPNFIEQLVTPEIATWNFAKAETAIVPQVRWVGEKIVLERYYTPQLAGRVVNFAITTGSAEARLINFKAAPPIFLLADTERSVYTVIDGFGTASVILVCDSPEMVVVDAHLYGYDQTSGTNSKFNTIFMKFETITLTDVDGKRDGHDSGIWTQTDEKDVTDYNPYNKYFPAPADGSQSVAIDPMPNDDTREQLNMNVSQDLLERVQVRGWFMGINDSTRPEAYQDAQLADNTQDQSLVNLALIDGKDISDSDETISWEGYSFDYSLPAHRWILPDDWRVLAGSDKEGKSNQWKQNRGQYDIMDKPNDSMVALEIDGEFFDLNHVMDDVIAPVIGPFAPGLERMTTNGWVTDEITSTDPTRQIKTVVPNGTLDAYDAPMPPAKILFEIIPDEESPYVSVGFFKETMKADVYTDFVMMKGHRTQVYTNPFYSTLVPAHWALSAFGGDMSGSYDWDSFWNNAEFDDKDEFVAPGPYYFWTILTRSTNPVTYSYNTADYPTAVEVYSDNHGEAMVWLNGDFNLYPITGGNGNQEYWRRFVAGNNGIDIQAGTVVGETVVQATAEYPYVRSEAQVTSNLVHKTWTWGGEVLGVDGRSFADKTESTSSINVLAAGNLGNVEGVTYDSGETDSEANDIWDDRATSDKHMAFIWATDRDGKMTDVLGTKVNWTVTNAEIDVQNSSNPNGRPLSSYNNITMGIKVDDNGFLFDTDSDYTDLRHGSSVMREPNDAEKLLFIKNWPSKYADKTLTLPFNYAVAGIMVYSGNSTLDITIDAELTGKDFGYVDFIDADGDKAVDESELITFEEGTVDYTINIPYAIYDEDTEETTIYLYPLDDPIVEGDANGDGEVNAADITAIERIILQLDSPDINADANSNGVIDMGDVVKVIRIIRGLD